MSARSTMTGGQALAAQLALECVDTVFGIPGLQIYHAVDGLGTHAPGIDFITTRHEQATAYMADGYARASGKPGVCLVVPGPGVLNILAALSTAYACSSPVLAICGQLATSAIGRDNGALHEINRQSDTLKTVTKWHAIARAAEEIPALVREAMVQLSTGTPRPVALEIPPDILAQEAEVCLVPVLDQPERRTPAPLPGELAALRSEIDAAQRPVLVVGGGCRNGRAGEAIAGLATRIGAPIALTANGLGSVPADHPLALGTLAGKMAIAQADLLIGIGTRFIGRSGPFGGSGAEHGARVALINTETAAFREPRVPDLAIKADATVAAEALLESFSAPAAPSWPQDGAHEELVQRCATWRAEAQSRIEAGIAPQLEYLRALQQAIPRDAVVVGEYTQLSYAAQLGFDFFTGSGTITPGYQGTLGYGYATALGAAVGQPGRAVVSVNGDGGFGWTLAELATARQYDIPVVAIVADDGAYGNVQRDQKAQFEGRAYGSQLRNPDFVALAGAFGIAASRAASPEELGEQVAAGIAAREPRLIHLPVPTFPTPWPLLA
ncbi:thiamine pyrophosphate-binding protein [Bogoriella caseilytica]|uniref:Acetolactate synthase-1/2/3 large subunit n=1 Tax=Bogoriella caseilytica TaxID=56055 RepID=A0A3N2BDH8_9MICO|nr:thiamine pyrophosphate-binding protein [Bogoriella caseilytica]ROR73310.1 acetolactate synthase-1/2/3 large subunit [Bogoriella caseilytica]